MNRYILIAAAIVLIFLVSSFGADLYYYNKVKQSPDAGSWQVAYSDFRVFWEAGRKFYFRYTNEPPYNPIDKRYGSIYDFNVDFYCFRYSPFAAFSFSVFTKLPMGVSLIIWSLMANIFFLLSIVLIDRILSKAAVISPASRIIASVIAALLVFRFYFNNIALGQTDVFILFLWVSFIIMYMRGSNIVSAILLAIIIQFKPFFLLVVPYIMFSGRWRLLLYAAAAFAALLAAPMTRVGYRQEWLLLIQDWMKIMAASVESQITNPKNQSLGYMLSKTSGFGGNIKAVYLSSALIYASLFIWFLALKNRLKKDSLFPAFEVSFITLAMLLSLPSVWKSSFVYTIVPIAFILYRCLRGLKDTISYPALAVFFLFTTILRPSSVSVMGFRLFNYFQPVPLGAFCLLVSMIITYRRACPNAGDAPSGRRVNS